MEKLQEYFGNLLLLYAGMETLGWLYSLCPTTRVLTSSYPFETIFKKYVWNYVALIGDRESLNSLNTGDRLRAI